MAADKHFVANYKNEFCWGKTCQSVTVRTLQLAEAARPHFKLLLEARFVSSIMNISLCCIEVLQLIVVSHLVAPVSTKSVHPPGRLLTTIPLYERVAMLRLQNTVILWVAGRGCNSRSRQEGLFNFKLSNKAFHQIYCQPENDGL